VQGAPRVAALAPERLFHGADALCVLLQVFQIVSQAIVQNFFPRFHIYHTSREHKGQVRAQFCGRACSGCVLALACLDLLASVCLRHQETYISALVGAADRCTSRSSTTS
jgi:hypothetical protein